MSSPLRCAFDRSSTPWLCALLLAAPLLAHGGQYRGPGDNKPPASASSGSGGGSTSGSSATGGGGSTASGGGGGTGSAPAGATSTPVGSATPRGVQLQDDPTRWEYWWEFRKDPFLRLRDSLYRPRATRPVDPLVARGPIALALQAPTANDRSRLAVPALLAALAAAEDRDTITGCLIALAKIGIDTPNQSLHALFRQHLASRDQEIRETAALCLGIARRAAPEDRQLLLSLLRDDSDGRAACDRAHVDERTRTFAAYGLGLLLPGEAPAVASQVVQTLLEQLSAAVGLDRNLKVAAIAALSLLPHTDDSAARTVREVAARGIDRYYLRDLGPGEELVQAHCPPAIARLLGRDHPRADEYRRAFAADLAGSLGRPTDDRRVRVNHHVAQSCALALGMLCRPWDSDASPDAAHAELLMRCWRDHKDAQTRNFALLAIGSLGGDLARARLLLELDRGSKSAEKPWAASALGALIADRNAAARAAGRTPDPDPEVGKALLAALREVKNPSTLGAIAIALGIGEFRSAADDLLRMLRENRSRDDLAGQLAVALALLEEEHARSELREMLPDCTRRPQLLVQVATSLGRLGDAAIVTTLTELLQSMDGGLARLSAVAGAVGQLADRRSIAPLIEMLENEQLTPLTRAFAAVALGSVCDKDSLPWNSTYAESLNYRAAVETLTDGAAGILDIL